MAAPDDQAVLGRFLLGLAEGMNAAAESVDHVRSTMNRVARAYGQPDTDFVVLPTVIFVQTGGSRSPDGAPPRVGMRSVVNVSFRFDQIAALYRLIGEAENAGVDPADGIRRLNEIGAMRPHYGWFVRTLGHAILTSGLALLLAPTWQAVVIAFGLGALLGLVKLVPSSTLQLIMPVFAAFVSALAVFLLAEWLPIGDPILMLIAPLATFLPGGVLTTGTVELAAGQMIAGASRLVMGFVQLALLAFGIIAAGSIVGVESSGYVPAGAGATLPWWVPAVGIVLFAVGNYLHFSGPDRSFWWVLLVLFVAYTAQSLGALAGGPTVGGFIGALVMTPVVLWIASLKHGAPSQLTFLPAFWLLVPGAAGLIGLTEAVGAERGLEDFAAAIVSIMSIALGVLIGTAFYRLVHHGAEELFHIDMPAEANPRPNVWQRIFGGFAGRRGRASRGGGADGSGRADAGRDAPVGGGGGADAAVRADRGDRGAVRAGEEAAGGGDAGHPASEPRNPARVAVDEASEPTLGASSGDSQQAPRGAAEPAPAPAKPAHGLRGALQRLRRAVTKRGESAPSEERRDT